MFVGEIGISRREFLYDIDYWEARRIIKGYRRRSALLYQLQRMNVWASMFCLGNPNNVRPDDLFPLYCDEEETEAVPELSAQEMAALQAEMQAFQFGGGTQ